MLRRTPFEPAAEAAGDVPVAGRAPRCRWTSPTVAATGLAGASAGASAIAATLLLVVALVACAAAEEPPLPEGLGGAPETSTAEPALPAGLGNAAEPVLPPGLGDTAKPEKGQAQPPEAPADRLPFDLTGFWELRGGFRLQEDDHEPDHSLGETRLQLELEKAFEEGLALHLTTDLLYDMSLNEHRVFMEEGRGLFDLREAYAAFRPTDFMDVKVGRQVLTWGTGDLWFLNDLFPKDWNSFLIGRDVEYLKAPSDAVKVSLFSDLANLDLVYTPRFDADRYIDGRYTSYYNPLLGRRAGRDAVIDPDDRDDWFREDEFAARAYRNVGAYEVALYGYYGYWKSPEGVDPVTFRARFPRLAAYGASVRGPVADGIGNVEVVYYDSMEDRSGNDPFTPNSQLRLLVGYSQDLEGIARDFTVGVQYYLEMRMDHDAWEATRGGLLPDENRERHMVTLRLTKLLLSQNLDLSLFAFFSPTDADAYMRPRLSYKVTDHWRVETGANVFFGNHKHTFFGQFEDNSNLYFAARYSF